MDCQYEVKEIVVVYNNYKLENADQVGNPVNRNLQYTDQEYKKLWNICLDIIVQLGDTLPWLITQPRLGVAPKSCQT